MSVLCTFVCLTEELSIRENVEIVCSMVDIFHDRALVMAFLHSMDIYVCWCKREGGKKLPSSVS